MPIREHPKPGTILMCDFSNGFKIPEMAKHRPVVVLTPKIMNRHHLCTVVALSRTAPDPMMPYHRQITITPALPRPWASEGVWVKGDMVNAVGFHRLDLIRKGKNPDGSRRYHYEPLDDENFKIVRQCVLRAMGLSTLTKHL